MRIGLLGGVRVTTDDGEPIDVGSAKSQTVLAALALSPGTPLPVSRLIDLVWDDDPPSTAPKALQWHVAQLRKVLGPATIARVDAAYRLDVPAGAVDVARFSRCLRDGDAAAALAQWGGPPLAGLDAPGLRAAVAGLTEDWLRAVEMDFERRVEADPREVVGELASLADRHPTREAITVLLMTALYRAGRQADALAAYRRTRLHLIGELGVEPGPALRSLEQQILAHQLPVRPDVSAAGLIGRSADLKALSDALVRSPVVTLVGPGGIGKTRLARAVAAPLVELAEITSSADVSRAVADTLGIVQRPGQTLVQSILVARPSLLVLDNCEHVLAGAAAFAQAVAPHVRVLATSRERLSVADEQVLLVEPLDVAASIELFHLRARAADPAYGSDFDGASGSDRDVAELCRRLDGIPLAIELAAARTRSHTPADLLARLDIGVRRTGATRHRTLRAAIQWSYDLLAPAEQQLFQRLSVFAAPFDLSAADDALLADLVERSMVTVHNGPFGRRFRLLEPIRQFAAEQLRDRLAAVSLHAQWCLRRVTHIHGLLVSHGEIEGVARLAELWPNLRAAVLWALERSDVRLADALVRPVVTELPLRGRQEIGDWAEQLLATTPMAPHHTHESAGDPPNSTLASGSDNFGDGESVPHHTHDTARVPPNSTLASRSDNFGDGNTSLRAFWLVWVAERNTQTSRAATLPDTPDHPLSRYAHAYATGDGEALQRCLPEAVTGLDPHLQAFLQLMPSGTLLGIGQFDHVDTAVSALADHYRRNGPPTLLHWALQTLGYSAMFQGRDPDRFFDEAADVELPATTLSANKTTAARAAFRKGDRDKACKLLSEHIDELLDTGNIVAASVVGVEFVKITAAIGKHHEAARVLGYLEHANVFGAMAARTLFTGITTNAPGMTDREALLYMRDALNADRERSEPRTPPTDPA